MVVYQLNSSLPTVNSCLPTVNGCSLGVLWNAPPVNRTLTLRLIFTMKLSRANWKLTPYNMFTCSQHSYPSPGQRRSWPYNQLRFISLELMLMIKSLTSQVILVHNRTNVRCIKTMLEKLSIYGLRPYLSDIGNESLGVYVWITFIQGNCNLFMYKVMLFQLLHLNLQQIPLKTKPSLLENQFTSRVEANLPSLLNGRSGKIASHD